MKREADESWSQVTARLEAMFTYYLRSREVQSFESLQELVIADRLKQLMSSDLRSLVTQQEVKGWLKPKDIAELAANFEESLDGSWQSNYRELMSDLKECEKGIRCVAQEIVPERCLSVREQEQVSRCSNPSANAVLRTLEEPPRSDHQVPNTEGEANTSLEDEREGEQDAQALEPLGTSSMSVRFSGPAGRTE
ncbi:hypothetical protein HPB50_019169 [Hyalomma asiaticum]|uniref:Uncharacterized protein n=1 Tax=Hyalomma asiaticum TaxID=266040 RepID=A0ACB7RPW7_HYAAI|nr:hypothetical protein HPB50_019169 [Hyalomma asiaticum]